MSVAISKIKLYTGQWNTSPLPFYPSSCIGLIWNVCVLLVANSPVTSDDLPSYIRRQLNTGNFQSYIYLCDRNSVELTTPLESGGRSVNNDFPYFFNPHILYSDWFQRNLKCYLIPNEMYSNPRISDTFMFCCKFVRFPGCVFPLDFLYIIV
jgi:hypothetical protein